MSKGITRPGIREFTLIALGILTFVTLVPASLAETVQFTQRELDSAFVLVKPETMRVELHGEGGVFDPPTALKYFGVEKSTFKIDLRFIGDLADIQFDRLQAGEATVRFKQNAFEVELPILDRAKGIRSRLGAISFQNVRLTAILGWKSRNDGRKELVLTSTRFAGTLKGSGLLNSKFALEQTRKLAMKQIGEQIQKILAREEVKRSLWEGLTAWARINTGDQRVSVNPSSLSFFEDSSGSGLRYETTF